MKTFDIEFISILYKKQRTVAKTKNGAKGISWFFDFFISKIKSPKTAPIQKEMRSAEKPEDMPSSHPIPKANLTSPKPIHLPLEKTHKRKSGSETKGPDKRKITEPFPKNKITEFTNASIIN